VKGLYLSSPFLSLATVVLLVLFWNPFKLLNLHNQD
jgi:hypothetical protein